MIVSRAVTDNLKKASWIRRMFEEGARLKQELGADRVFDFTLGNPEIEPPAAVLAAARRVLDSGARHLHAYMLASAPGRPASEYGALCQGDEDHAGGGRWSIGDIMKRAFSRVAPPSRQDDGTRSRDA